MNRTNVLFLTFIKIENILEVNSDTFLFFGLFGRVMKWVLVLLLLMSCISQPYVQPAVENKTEIVEKVVVQCWDNSTADSVEKCPPEKVEQPELPPAKVIVEQPVPIARKLLEDAQSKFKGYAYVLSDRMVVVYGNKLRHLFFKVSQLEDDTPITDIFVDLDKKEATAYCNVEREGKILDDSFDWDRSRCKEFVDKKIPVPFDKWVPKGPLEYLEEFADAEPVLVEDNIQTISIGGNSKSIQPSLHYMVDSKRVVLRIDKRYKVPVKVEIEGSQSVDFRDAYFDVMVLYGGQQKITPEWVEYQPVSEYWKVAAANK